MSKSTNLTKKQLAEQKRQATLLAKRAKREVAEIRARMADYFYSQSVPNAESPK